MRCEVVAVGTELLLGQIVDTNSSWIGEQLALHGIDSHFQTKVGDNADRIVAALRGALERSDAVICCGGLGPTQDDITRECIATVMGVGLERDPAVVEKVRTMFAARGRTMSENNARQGDKPIGTEFIDNPIGTAPGLLCVIPSGDGAEKVIYAVPGVPYEMKLLMEQTILPDLARRSGITATIRSRTLRTWGLAESALAEMVGHRLEALDRPDAKATIAFLASGIEGIKVRVTVKAVDEAEARDLMDAEEAELRAILGDVVFGLDDETMEVVVGQLLQGQGLTLAVAEDVTGGLLCSRITATESHEQWFAGGRIGVQGAGSVGVAAADQASAARVRAEFGASVGLAIVGGDAPGVVRFEISDGNDANGPEIVEAKLPGDRERLRQFAVISALDALRRRLTRSAA